MKSSFVFVVGLVCFIALFGFSTNAATINVPGDYDNIIAAVGAANNGDTIVVAAGTYVEPNIAVAKDITIQGAGASTTIISANGINRGMNITGDVTLSGFTIQDGVKGGGAGILFEGSTSTISDCIIKDCTATASPGGGILCTNLSAVTITDSTIQGNTASLNDGGGIGISNTSSLTLNNCTISGNTSTTTNGGGIKVAGSTLTVTSSTISGNTAAAGTGSGGGIIAAASTLTVTSSTITGNTSVAGGGGIASNGGSTVTVTSSTISNNTVTSQGGGGIDLSSNAETLTITASTISGNTTPTSGGGIRTDSTATITNCLIRDNEAQYGGAIYIEENEEANITNCTIVSNTSTYEIPMTIFFNSAAGGTIRNCVIANNGASYGIYAGAAESVTMLNNNIYNNTLGLYTDGMVTCTTAEALNALSYSSGNIDGNPQFISSSDFDIQSDSPCIDAGTSTGAPSTDIAGTTRPQGAGYDIGCYEFVASTWYLAEGCTRTGFQEYILVQNPGSTSTDITVTYYNGAGETATTDTVTIPATSRYTIDVNDELSTDTDFNNADVSAKVVPTNNVNIWVDRSMYLTAGAAHSTRGVTSTATTWYFAEGSTDSYETYLLLFNPNTSAASVTLTFMKSDGTTEVTDAIPVGANTRVTLDLDDYIADEHFSTKVVSTVAIVAERSMYWAIDGTSKAGGHNSMGSTATGTTWYFAEGCTDGFTGWLLLQNSNSSSASVTITLMKTDGTTEEATTLMYPTSRRTISLDDILDNESFAIKVVSDVGIVAERSMYWDTGGHCSIGSTSTASTWYLAEGCVLTVDGDTYTDWLLIQNPGNNSEQVTLTFMDNDGDTQTSYVTILPTSRISVDLGQVISIDGQFSTKAVATDPVVIERSIYKGTGDGHNSIGMN